MTPNRVVIIGAGGQGREIHDIVDAVTQSGDVWEVVGYLDDAASEENLGAVAQRGSILLGDVDALSLLPHDVGVLLGLGDAAVRDRIGRRKDVAEREAPVLVHPAATLGSSVILGQGTVLWAGSRLSTRVETGRHVHINHNATVGHDTTMDDYATLHPAAVVSGSVRIGRAATIGANAFIRQRLSVGERSFVGASAAAIRDIPADTIVKGVPAR